MRGVELKESCNSLSIRVLELEEENRQLKVKLLEFLQDKVDELPEEFRMLAQPSVDLVKEEFGV